MQARRREQGTVVVEFALVLPFLVLLLFGFLFVGLSMNSRISATQVAASGARYIAVNQNPGTAASQTMPNYLKARLDSTDARTASVCVTYPAGTTVGQYAQVTITYSRSLIPFLRTHTGHTNVSFTSTARMRLEAVPSTIPAGCST